MDFFISPSGFCFIESGSQREAGLYLESHQDDGVLLSKGFDFDFFPITSKPSISGTSICLFRKTVGTEGNKEMQSICNIFYTYISTYCVFSKLFGFLMEVCLYKIEIFYLL